MAESEDGLSDYLREEQELLEEEQPEEESPAMTVQVHADEEDDDGEAAAFPSVTPSPAASPAVSPAASRAGSSSSSARRGRSRGSLSHPMVEEESNNEETEAERIWRQANPQQGINSDDGVESSSEYGSTAFGTRQAARPTLQSMSNYSTNISQILCNPDILSPVLPHGPESNGGWLEFGKIFKSEAEAEAEAEGGNDVEMRGMCPARAMCFNLPKSMFRQDADRLRDMRSNLENQSRATNINALFGLLWTPLSKAPPLSPLPCPLPSPPPSPPAITSTAVATAGLEKWRSHRGSSECAERAERGRRGRPNAEEEEGGRS